MAIYKQGYLGAFSGKLGNVIGTFWKGISVMRVVPANVTNPNTLAQQAQRSRFKLLMSFLNTNIKFFKVGFAAKDVRMTEINAAYKENYPGAIIGIYPTLSIDVKNLVPSLGKLIPLDGLTATSTVANTIDLSWTDNSSVPGAGGNDKINMAVFDETTGESITILQGANRLDETAMINLPVSWTGRTVSLYAYLTSEKADTGVSKPEHVSNSVHISGITVV